MHIYIYTYYLGTYIFNPLSIDLGGGVYRPHLYPIRHTLDSFPFADDLHGMTRSNQSRYPIIRSTNNLEKPKFSLELS